MVPFVWPTSGGNILFENVGGNTEMMNKNAGRMFTEGQHIEIEVCVVGVPSMLAKCFHLALGGLFDSRLIIEAWPARILTSLKALRECMDETDREILQKSNTTRPNARIFFISLKHSRSEMSLTKEAMTLILSQIQAFPAFVNILSSVGLLTRETTSGIVGFSSFYGIIEEENSVFETAYMLKYAERNGFAYGDPWSIRTMNIYQRFNYPTQLSDTILIHISEQVKKRFSQLNRDGHISMLPDHWTYLHEIILGTLSHNWSAYIADVETKLSKVDFNYFFTRVDADGPQHLHFEDLKVLNQGIDILSRISHAIQLNIEVLNHLSQEASRRTVVEGEEKNKIYARFQQNLRTCTTEQTFLNSHVSLLQTFADRRASQLRDAIALQNSNITMEMSQKSIQEAQTMRTITLVALIYLPASFVATFLSMGFMHVTSLGGIMGVDVNRDMWLYLAITAPLMVVTFLAWGIWDWGMRRKDSVGHK